MAKKWGFCLYCRKVGLLSIWHTSGVFINMGKKWGFLNMAKKWGFCEYGKKVGFLSIWQKSGGLNNMAKKWMFC
jgi:hypothetical protein